MAERPTFSTVPGRSVLEPDRSRFVDPWNDVDLLSYYEDITKWHGYIRFLGLPHLREDPDQPLRELYVEPFLSRTLIQMDASPEEWLELVEPALAAIVESPRLVLLGDPGSGKSTLVSWIAWQLTQPRSNPWRERLGPLVPLPFVLRELTLGPDLSAGRLLDAFLRHPVAARLRSGDRLLPLLESGQALLLLDGLDEIGNLEARRALRRSVFDLSARFPGCRLLLTSRAVGYEQVSFHELELAPYRDPRELLKRQPWSALRYVTPFSDEQIEQFAHNWYARREAAAALRDIGASDLIKAIKGTPSTLRLARNPNLLTLMALVHRVQRRLPHGRAFLFDKIAEAYLESIDTFRGIQEIDYPLAQKKRWLAYIAFQMQLQRGAGAEGEANPSEAQGPREVLAEREKVEQWLLEAMEQSSRGADRETANRFLDYIGRRSGLLFPRGEGLFAFTHLSFQEYFAAVFLADQVTSPRWTRGKASLGASPKDLRSYANQATWREVLVLLFELLADRPDWVEELADSVFGDCFRGVLEELADRSQQAKAELLAELSIDPYSGLSHESRLRGFRVCWHWEMETQQSVAGAKLVSLDCAVARRLLAADLQIVSAVWKAFDAISSELKPRFLVLRNLPAVEENLLGQLVELLHLDLENTLVSNLQPLSRLQNLSNLSLKDTRVADIGTIHQLENLRALNLDRTLVSDIEPLRGLQHLEFFYLSGTSVTDLTPLQRQFNLRVLYLSQSVISDISPLQHLENLETLGLSQTYVSDLSSLKNMKKLKELFLYGTPIKDESQIERLQAAGVKIYR